MGNNYLYFGSRASTIDNNNNLWISSYFYNGFLKINVDSLDVSYIGMFPDNDMKNQRLHLSAHTHGTEIIFTPYYCNNIHIYDTYENKFRIVKLPNIDGKSFLASINIEDKIYLLSDKGILLCYNIKEGTIIVDQKLSEKITDFVEKAGDRWTYSDDENGYTLYDRNSNVLRIDLKKYLVACHRIKSEYNNLEIAYCDDNTFWFSMEGEQNLLNWNPVNNQYYLFEGNNGWGKDGFKFNPYNKIGKYNDTVYFTNYHAGTPIRIDKVNKKIVPLTDKFVKNDIFGENEVGPIYSDIHFTDNKVIMVPCYGKKLIIYDFNSNESKEVEFAIAKDKINSYREIMKATFDEGVYESREFFGLNDLIRYMLY